MRMSPSRSISTGFSARSGRSTSSSSRWCGYPAAPDEAPPSACTAHPSLPQSRTRPADAAAGQEGPAGRPIVVGACHGRSAGPSMPSATCDDRAAARFEGGAARATASRAETPPVAQRRQSKALSRRRRGVTPGTTGYPAAVCAGQTPHGAGCPTRGVPRLQGLRRRCPERSSSAEPHGGGVVSKCR